MTVLQATTVRRTQAFGYAERALPDGVWVSEGTVTGDATGGLRQIFHTFRPGGLPTTALMYSLEYANVSDGDTAPKNLEMESEAFTGMFPWEVTLVLPMVAGLQGTTELSFEAVDALRGLLLGTPTPNASGASVLVVMVSNVNLEPFSSRLAGYIWGPAALTAPGGPQRPASGLFRV